MARIRTIKPEFFIDDDVARLKPLTRMLFIGLWCLADKSGRLEDKPARIKIQVLPYDNYDADAGLNELCSAGFINRYTTDNQKLIEIKSFTKHQKTHATEKESMLPPFNGEVTVKEPLNTGYETTGKERKGRERKGREGNIKTKTTLPPDFDISDAVKKWAAVNGFLSLGQHLESFKAKCKANGYRYLDWDAAFQEAIRADWAKIREKGGNGNGKYFPGNSGRMEPELPAEAAAAITHANELAERKRLAKEAAAYHPPPDAR